MSQQRVRDRTGFEDGGEEPQSKNVVAPGSGKRQGNKFHKPHGTADTTVLGQGRPAGASGLQNQ